MLGGIKIGKKKKQNADSRLQVPPSSTDDSTTQGSDAGKSEGSVSKRASSHSTNDATNMSVADQLRRSLAAGIHCAARPVRTDEDGLERRGRIREAESCDDGRGAMKSDTIILLTDRLMPASLPKKGGSEMTIQEMMAEEVQNRYVSQAEVESRDAIRLNKKRRLKVGNAADSDEEEERQMQAVWKQQNPSAKDTERSQSRDRSRQLFRYDRQTQITSKCCWWMEAGPDAFQRHRLIALGDHVTLVMAPIKLSLTKGEHFYLVPIPHVESLASCDDCVWNEIRLFQRSLQTMYRKEKKAVLFFETVLPNNNFWQTKLECIIVPLSVAADAQLHFRSALTEIAEEWGTHQKLMKIGGAHKELRRSIPANFSYIYMEYGNPHDNNDGEGYVQMIESNDFPKDFAVDTVAGMMKMDPMRFRANRASTSTDEEKRLVSLFVEKWKPVDWTQQLDAGKG